MTNEEFDKARFHKGMRATLHATIICVDFERRKLQLRVDGRESPMYASAKDIDLEDET